MLRSITSIFLGICFIQLSAQRKIENSSDLFQEIKKLNVLTNVLYLAAHPDDENTRLIAWLENEKLARTAYLSLTRGDGGQNLIGTEKGDGLGVIRTQELLEARKLDGAEQFFSRATDFGYSKTPEETFDHWDREKVLGDVVYIIRKFKPDVIITRFPPDSRAGHGHHTASAQLAEEAFKLAADKTAYPEHLEQVETWQAKRILWNTSVWWDQQLAEKAAKAEDYIKIDIGSYNPILGLAYSELAADSRSQHKSQGFGSARTRGEQIEYLKHTAGDQAKEDLFEDIKTDWSRISGTNEIASIIHKIIANFKQESPFASIDDLLALYNLLEAKKDNFYVREKLESLKQIIKSCIGLHVEALADEYNFPSFQEVSLKGKFELVVQSNVPVKLLGGQAGISTTFENQELIPYKLTSINFTNDITTNPSQPYWLDVLSYDEIIKNEPYLRGIAENPKLFEVKYELSIKGTNIQFSEPIDYKWTDRVDGELHRDVYISPEVTVNSDKSVYLVSDQSEIEVNLMCESNKDSLKTEIATILPEGWKSTPEKINLEFKHKGDQRFVSFKLIPPANSSEAELKFNVGGMLAHSVEKINYPHIRPQVYFPIAAPKLVKLDLKKTPQKIAYIIGSGDEVAENLSSLGYQIKAIKANDLAKEDLSSFGTIIVGIRAYNTEESMINGNEILNDFVYKGGNVIVQYNTNRGLKTENIGPYPFKISRERVSVEEIAPQFILPKHPVLNEPNKLSLNDFEGWVQERGLYFAGEWDEHFQAPIEWHDPGEEEQKGSLIVCDYGKGHFMYTGISFFRQLPAGVPGAYKLMVNMISYGK